MYGFCLLNDIFVIWTLNTICTLSLIYLCTYLLRKHMQLQEKKQQNWARLSSVHICTTLQSSFQFLTNKTKMIIYTIFLPVLCIYQPTCIFPLIVLRVNTNIYSLIFCENSFFWIVDGYLRLVLTVESMWLRAVFLEYIFLLVNYSFICAFVSWLT